MPQEASKAGDENDKRVETSHKPPIVPTPQEFWLQEIWKENRDIFKTLITHPLLFSIPIGSLLLFDYIIRHSALEEAEQKTLLKIDFYGIAIVLAIFTFSFIIEIVVLVSWKVKHGK